ncbi:MAG: hypothetical protein GF315_05130 [candidate division Zixibacteria bacterium]|nr:hypothetical protein [candidate division Zixibacteria bacterium]
MRMVIRISFFVALLFLACVLLPANAVPQEVKFNFNPPEELTFEQILTITKITEKGEAGKRTEITTAHVKVEMEKTPAGYRVMSTPLSLEMSIDGKEANSPILSLLQDIEVVYNLDENGNVLSIQGYDKLEKLIRDSFPPDVGRQLATVLNEEAMINKEIAEWNSRIVDFVDLDTEIGDVFLRISDYPLPTGGTVSYHTATKLASMEQCDSNKCVRIEFAYNIDPDALADFIGEAIKNFGKELGVANQMPAMSDVSMAGKGERLIDPATMLIYHERIERTLRFVAKHPDRGEAPITQHETREYTYKY